MGKEIFTPVVHIQHYQYTSNLLDIDPHFFFFAYSQAFNWIINSMKVRDASSGDYIDVGGCSSGVVGWLAIAAHEKATVYG